MDMRHFKFPSFFSNCPTMKDYRVFRFAGKWLGFVSNSESVTKALPEAALLRTSAITRQK